MNKENLSFIPRTIPFAIIGGCLPLVSILYKLVLYYFYDYRVVCFSTGIMLILIAVLWMCFRNGKRNYEQMSKKKQLKSSYNCLSCIRNNSVVFNNRGLLYLDDLTQIEKNLSSSSKVLIYGSDLASEINVEKTVKENRKRKVSYTLLYFAEHCGPEKLNEIKSLYGKDNLVLLNNKKYKNSFDGRLADSLDFDVFIVKFNKREFKGYFAVDYAVNYPPDFPLEYKKNRPCHLHDCTEKCNYGKEYNERKILYKEFSSDLAEQLYYEGVNIKKELKGE